MSNLNANNLSNYADSLQTTNSNIGILDNLFGLKKVDNFYDAFYNAFLTTANTLPINSLWVVYMNSVPSNIIQDWIEPYEGWKNLGNTYNTAKKEGDVKYRKKGIILAQGVKINGESVNIERYGQKETGYVTGLVGKGRTPFPTLKIQFMENNVSFVDFTLRPWMVAVSHASLKNQSLKTDIIVWVLTKAGARVDLAKRKAFIYHNCCPINIDESEHNYTGSEVLRLRSVEFCYTHYTLVEADEALLRLVASSTDMSYLGSLTGKLKNELQRQFGANNPTQYINNLIDKAKQFGSDLVTGTATNIVTNVAGSVQGKINSAINGVQTSIIGSANKLTSSITDATNNLLGNTKKSSQNNPPKRSGVTSINAVVDQNKSVLSGSTKLPYYVEKNISRNDTPISTVKNNTEILLNKASVVDTNKTISENDTVTSPIQLKYDLIKPNPIDNIPDTANIKYIFKMVNENDIP